MFSKFSSILQQAVDALAPESTPKDDFLYHWKCITNFYVDNTDDKCPVNSTNIPSHLSQMLVVLVEEEQEREAGNTGPCMEYMLQHKLLETLHTLGRADCPPGMKTQVLRFFTSLLGRIHQPLLPHVNVHRPVSKLVRVCGEVAAAPTETEEIAFLCTVCARLKQEPHLAHLFLRSKEKNAKDKESNQNNQENATQSSKDDPEPVTSSAALKPQIQESSGVEDISGGSDLKENLHSYSRKRDGYDLVDSLLNLTKSEDGRVAVKACEGLMLLVSLKHKDAARALVQDTALCYLLNLRLSSLFSSLPDEMDPVDIENIEAKWGLDSRLHDGHKFKGKRALVSFLSWFDYCDRLAAEGSSRECREYICKSIRQQFFEGTLCPMLCATNEHAILTSTSIFAKLFSSVECKDLLREMLLFLLADSKDKDTPSLLLRLLERCDHLSDEISIMSLQLFETVLRKNDPVAIESLILQHLQNRGYHMDNPGNIDIQTEPAELEWDMEPGLDSSTSEAAEESTDSPSRETESQRGAQVDKFRSGCSLNSVILTAMNVAKYNPRLHVQQAVNCYLNILPEAAKSSQTFDDDSGHDSYLREAHRMYREVQFICGHFKWPKDFESPDRCKAVVNFNEGPFMRMLLNKISRLLDQPYEVNLVITSIASRLCLTPHALLHEYFVDPLTPMRPNVRTLYGTIQQITTEMMARFTRVSNFKNKLLSTRKSLVGNNASHMKNSQGSHSIQMTNIGNELSHLLEGAIVLEEFCKELAAILFVKHHASSATFNP